MGIFVNFFWEIFESARRLYPQKLWIKNSIKTFYRILTQKKRGKSCRKSKKGFIRVNEACLPFDVCTEICKPTDDKKKWFFFARIFANNKPVCQFRNSSTRFGHNFLFAIYIFFLILWYQVKHTNKFKGL